MFIGRTDVGAETPILWAPDAKSWLIWIVPDFGKGWGQEETRTTEDEMVGWHHQLDGHEFGWTPGVRDGQWGLACCDSWGHKESDMTDQLNWTELKAFDCVDTTNLKSLQETGIPDYLTCLMRNLYTGQEATVRTGLGTLDWFQIGKGVCQDCMLSPCLFN